MEIDKYIIRDLPDPFNFYYLLTSAGHLHFGLWSDDCPDASLDEAQEQMFAALLAFFPRPPASVLDVGCGFGVSAHSLSQRGYEVTGIAPSAALIRHATEHFGDEYTDFQLADFLGEAGAPFMEKSYDVILFQESLQYFPSPAAVFQRCRALLKPGGFMIISDEIRCDDTLKDQSAVHSRREVLLPLYENGFRLTRHLQIGSQVKKTCDQVIDVFTRDFDHLVAAVDQPDAAERLRYFLAGWKSQRDWYASGRMSYELFVARKDPVFIRAYREGDEEKILPMFNRIFFQQRSLAHWRWKYRDNPFGSHKIVVAVDDEGTLAGHFAAYPVPCHAPAAKPGAGLVFHGGDTMTNPDFRHLGRGKTSVLGRLFSYFYPKFCEGNIPYLYGFNTATIRKLGERYLGYEYTSLISLYVLKPEGKRSADTNFLRKWLSGISINRVTSMNEEFDHFFERVGDDYHSLVKRSALYLQWRYLDCPDTEYHVLAVRKRGELVGWGVFALQDDTLVWGDALFARRFATVAASALLGQVQKDFFGKISRIEAWFSPAPSWWVDILGRMGFAVEPEPNRLAPAYTIFDRNFSVDFFEKNHYYTMGDSDLF